jgi:hypothetical protein
MDVVKDGAARRGWLPKDWAIGLKQCVGLAPGRPRFALARSEGRAQAAAAKKQEAAANATKRITEQDVESRRHRGLLLRSCVMVQTLRRLRPGAQGFGKELSASSQGHVFLYGFSQAIPAGHWRGAARMQSPPRAQSGSCK